MVGKTSIGIFSQVHCFIQLARQHGNKILYFVLAKTPRSAKAQSICSLSP